MKKILFLFLTVLAASLLASEYKPTPQDRKSNRPASLWRDYRHGITDDFSTPFTPVFKDYETKEETIKSGRFTGKVKVWVVPAGKGKMSKTLPIDAKKYRGKMLRFFYWMRGIETGSRPVVNSYHDAPQIYVVTKDAKQKTLTKIISHNGAVGTFPWHCYYLDIFVPLEASSFRLVLENLKRGTGEYAKFSYEEIGPHNTYSGDERQDPETGSIAAFPRYEPINFHFFTKPFGTKYKWNFMRGPAAGMIGQPYDITTIEGLRKYFKESVKTDLDQQNHGIMYFPMRYNQAKRAGCLPDMPENWLEEVGKLIIEDQNPGTGYWGTKYIPESMSVTFHYIDMMFAFGFDRPDMKAQPDKNRIIAPKIPRADKIVASTLALQSHTPDGKLAAWNHAAYNFTKTPDAGRSKIQLGSTMNAIRLLRLCRQFVNPELQQRIDESIKAAFLYGMKSVILPNGVFKQQDVDKTPTKASYWESIITFSHYLEPRTDPGLPAPQLVKDKRQVKVAKWLDGQNSIRIYMCEKPENFTPDKLAGIISSGDQEVIQLDPYLATRKMHQAQRATWGGKRPKGYAADKVKKLPRKLSCAVKDGSITLPRLKKGCKFYAVSVDWYGAESLPVELK